MSLEAAIAQVNRTLERISIREKAGKLYLRGRKKESFPPKPNGEQPNRAEIATGFSASPSGLKYATSLAKKIDAQLIWGEFNWLPYLKGKDKPPETVEEWLNRYEENHWRTTPSTPTKQNTFHRTYRLYFLKLPQDQPLTLDLLKKTIDQRSAPATRSREFFCIAFGKLAAFAARHGAFSPDSIEVFKAELKELKKGYEPKPLLPEALPTDEEIVAFWQSIKNPAWRWVYGMLATYGLRPSEVFRLDLSRFTKDTEHVRVLEETKTGARLAYPVLPSWREEFRLWEATLPNIQRVEQRCNSELGTKVLQAFRDYKIPHSPYKLRHAWAIRTVLLGAPDTIGAKWAGHSVAVRTKTYHQALSQDQHSQIFFQMKEAEKILRGED